MELQQGHHKDSAQAKSVISLHGPGSVDELRMEKFHHICKSWEDLTYVKSRSIEKYVYALFCNTVRYTMSLEWETLGMDEKNRLKVALMKSAYRMCQTLAELLPHLWGQFSIRALFCCNPEDGSFDRNYPLPPEHQCSTTCHSEPRHLTRARVEILCEAACEEEALQLCLLCSSCAALKDDYFYVETAVSILFRMGNISQMTTEVSKLTCHDGFQLIQLIMKKRAPLAFPLVQCLTQILLVQDFVGPSSYCCTLSLMSLWCSLHVLQKSSLDIVSQEAHKLGALASTSAHLYLFVDVLYKQYGRQLLLLYLHLYLHALTLDLNNLEYARLLKCDVAVTEMETHMAAIYTKLATLLVFGDDVRLARECVLTAFSLEPTADRLSCLRQLASKEKDRGPPRLTPCAGECYCSEKGLCRQEQLVPPWYKIYHPHDILDFTLEGATPDLLQDLCIVLEGPRCRWLSWNLPWEALNDLCEQYLLSSKELGGNAFGVGIEARLKRMQSLNSFVLPMFDVVGAASNYDLVNHKEEKMSDVVQAKDATSEREDRFDSPVNVCHDVVKTLHDLSRGDQFLQLVNKEKCGPSQLVTSHQRKQINGDHLGSTVAILSSKAVDGFYEASVASDFDGKDHSPSATVCQSASRQPKSRTPSDDGNAYMHAVEKSINVTASGSLHAINLGRVAELGGDSGLPPACMSAVEATPVLCSVLTSGKINSLGDSLPPCHLSNGVQQQQMPSVMTSQYQLQESVDKFENRIGFNSDSQLSTSMYCNLVHPKNDVNLASLASDPLGSGVQGSLLESANASDQYDSSVMLQSLLDSVSMMPIDSSQQFNSSCPVFDSYDGIELLANPGDVSHVDPFASLTTPCDDLVRTSTASLLSDKMMADSCSQSSAVPDGASPIETAQAKSSGAALFAIEKELRERLDASFAKSSETHGNHSSGNDHGLYDFPAVQPLSNSICGQLHHSIGQQNGQGFAEMDKVEDAFEMKPTSLSELVHSVLFSDEPPGYDLALAYSGGAVGSDDLVTLPSVFDTQSPMKASGFACAEGFTINTINRATHMPPVYSSEMNLQPAGGFQSTSGLSTDSIYNNSGMKSAVNRNVVDAGFTHAVSNNLSTLPTTTVVFTPRTFNTVAVRQSNSCRLAVTTTLPSVMRAQQTVSCMEVNPQVASNVTSTVASAGMPPKAIASTMTALLSQPAPVPPPPHYHASISQDPPFRASSTSEPAAKITYSSGASSSNVCPVVLSAFQSPNGVPSANSVGNLPTKVSRIHIRPSSRLTGLSQVRMGTVTNASVEQAGVKGFSIKQVRPSCSLSSAIRPNVSVSEKSARLSAAQAQSILSPAALNYVLQAAAVPGQKRHLSYSTSVESGVKQFRGVDVSPNQTIQSKRVIASVQLNPACNQSSAANHSPNGGIVAVTLEHEGLISSKVKSILPVSSANGTVVCQNGNRSQYKGDSILTLKINNGIESKVSFGRGGAGGGGRRRPVFAHRKDRCKWMSVINPHGKLGYRKVGMPEEKLQDKTSVTVSSASESSRVNVFGMCSTANNVKYVECNSIVKPAVLNQLVSRVMPKMDSLSNTHVPIVKKCFSPLLLNQKSTQISNGIKSIAVPKVLTVSTPTLLQVALASKETAAPPATSESDSSPKKKTALTEAAVSTPTSKGATSPTASVVVKQSERETVPASSPTNPACSVSDDASTKSVATSSVETKVSNTKSATYTTFALPLNPLTLQMAHISLMQPKVVLEHCRVPESCVIKRPVVVAKEVKSPSKCRMDKFPCPVCEKRLSSPFCLRRHMRAVHKLEVDGKTNQSGTQKVDVVRLDGKKSLATSREAVLEAFVGLDDDCNTRSLRTETSRKCS